MAACVVLSWRRSESKTLHRQAKWWLLTMQQLWVIDNITHATPSAAAAAARGGGANITWRDCLPGWSRVYGQHFSRRGGGHFFMFLCCGLACIFLLSFLIVARRKMPPQKRAARGRCPACPPFWPRLLVAHCFIFTTELSQSADSINIMDRMQIYHALSAPCKHK